uniref:uncharacterized protein LOC124021734 isoform X2 n=1 Tax=Oncorhynchus gorbuscha TaxID=8017 RepID=UPI001EAEF14C|nr:uncharacterized protein LOC124021734 isoform X2 [Oncorhynchus gorbuscha]
MGRAQRAAPRAWLSLPHGMRVFYPHAYCSRVWSEAAAHRLTTLGHRARQGDLVWKQRREEGIEAGETSLPQIHVVTAAEEEEEVYSLGQVVLPMLGNTVKYPENPIGGWYQERLARDGLQSCRFRVTPLKLNLPGCYRPLLAIPHSLTYRLEQGQRAGERQQEWNGKSQASGAVAQYPDTDTTRPGGLERQRGGESTVQYPDTDTTRPGGQERQRGGSQRCSTLTQTQLDLEVWRGREEGSQRCSTLTQTQLDLEVWRGREEGSQRCSTLTQTQLDLEVWRGREEGSQRCSTLTQTQLDLEVWRGREEGVNDAVP